MLGVDESTRQANKTISHAVFAYTPRAESDRAMVWGDQFQKTGSAPVGVLLEPLRPDVIVIA
jgi:hypothetical protein